MTTWNSTTISEISNEADTEDICLLLPFSRTYRKRWYARIHVYGHDIFRLLLVFNWNFNWDFFSKTFYNGVLSIDEYLKVEQRYIEAAMILAWLSGCTYLTIGNLEGQKDILIHFYTMCLRVIVKDWRWILGYGRDAAGICWDRRQSPKAWLTPVAEGNGLSV